MFCKSLINLSLPHFLYLSFYSLPSSLRLRHPSCPSLPSLLSPSLPLRHPYALLPYPPPSFPPSLLITLSRTPSGERGSGVEQRPVEDLNEPKGKHSATPLHVGLRCRSRKEENPFFPLPEDAALGTLISLSLDPFTFSPLQHPPPYLHHCGFRNIKPNKWKIGEAS